MMNSGDSDSELADYILDQLTGAYCDSDDVEGLASLRERAAENPEECARLLAGLDLLLSYSADRLTPLLDDLGTRVNAEFPDAKSAKRWLSEVRKGLTLGEVEFAHRRGEVNAAALLVLLRKFLRNPNDTIGVEELKQEIGEAEDMKRDLADGVDYLVTQDDESLQRRLTQGTGFLFRSTADARAWLLLTRSRLELSRG